MANVFDNESPNVITQNTGFGGQQIPTAKIHIAGSNGLSNTSPLKFSPGTLLITAETGAVEFDGNHLYMTINGIRSQLDNQSGGQGVLTLESLTTSQRNSLTPVNGLLINNSDVNQFQKYENNQWVDISKSPATKVVAPAGSGYAADYYTDGVADDVQIQQALNALSGGLGVVLIKTGTYNINPNQITLPINSGLYGEGYGTLLQLQGAGNLFQLTSDPSQPNGFRLYNTIENMRLDGGTILGSYGILCGQYGQEFNVKNCWFHNFGNRHDGTLSSAAINANGTNKKFQLIGNWFGGSTTGNSVCIILSTTGDVQIVGNNFHDFYEAIHGNTEKTNITGNDIYNGDGNGINVGTTSGGLTQINVAGNTISDCGNYGILIGLTTALGANIVGNYFRNINNNAIWIRGANHAIVGNYFQNIARTGVGNNACGITLNDGCTNIEIHNNNIYNTHTNMTYGIAALNTVIGNISIRNNSVTGAQLADYREAITNNTYEDTSNLLINGSANYTLSMLNNPNSAAAGSNLTITAGGALSTSTNMNGGSLILGPGASTGSGIGSIQFQTSPATSSTLSAIFNATVASGGSGYIVSDVLTITGGGGTSATVTVASVALSGEILSVGLDNGGTGYVAGDVLTLVGGTGGTITVNQTTEINGTILAATLTTDGSGYTTGTNIATTGGTGTGATFNVTAYAAGQIKSISITTRGTGYSQTNGATTSGGTGTGATLNIFPYSNSANTLVTSMTLTPTALNLTTLPLNTVGNIEIDGTANRDITVGRATTGAGVPLTVQSGGAQSGATDTGGALLLLAGGIATGNGGSNIDFYTTRDSQGSGTTDRNPSFKMRLSSSNNGRLFIGNVATSGSVDGIELQGTVSRTIQSARNTTANTAGNTLTISGGGATIGATDKNGGNLFLQPGISTGIGRNQVNIKGFTTAVSTGTGDNTLLDRMIVGAFKALTNNSVISLVNCTLTSGSVGGFTLRYSVEVTDGTDYQIEQGSVSFMITNKAGTIANNNALKFGNQQAATSGTLSCTFTITAANPAVISLNANSSLTPATGYPRVTYSIENLTQQAIAIQ